MGHAKNGTFKYLRDRVWDKIKGWMEKIFAGGKEILIKSIAKAVPVFTMSCFKLPRGLCEHLNSLIRKFWWGEQGWKKKGKLGLLAHQDQTKGLWRTRLSRYRALQPSLTCQASLENFDRPYITQCTDPTCQILPLE